MCNRDTNCLIKMGTVDPACNSKFHQRNIIYSEEGISPCQTSTQFKDPIRVLIEVDDEKETK